MKKSILIAAAVMLAGISHGQMFAQMFGGSAWTPASLSPVAWWRMDDNAASTVVVDSAGTNTGTSVQNTSAMATNGINRGALAFNGSSDFMTSTNKIGVTGASGRSVSFWIYPRSATNRQTIVSMGQFANYKMWSPEFNGVSGGPQNIYVAGFNADVYTTNTLPLNSWSHVVITYSGGAANTGTKIYYNGASQSIVGMAVTLETTDSVIGIGKDIPGNRQPFNGFVDDVFFWHRALTPAEITQLYQWRQ
jgi:hypothetical protein